MKKYFIALCIVGFALSSGITSAQVEVVQSVPVETTLEVPGIRQTQAVWLEMVRAARKSLNIEQFYVNSPTDSQMSPVLDAVRAAAARGVPVRVVLDKKFAQNYPNPFPPHACLEVRTVDFDATDGVQHAKFFVVDEQSAFVGSANFDTLALNQIHEVGLKITDSVTSGNLNRVFEMDWGRGVRVSAPTAEQCVAGVDPFITPAESPSALPEIKTLVSPPASSPRGMVSTLGEIQQLLAAATDTVNIQLYQYTTEVYRSRARWTGLDGAIRGVRPGVRVRLLVDAVSLRKGRAELTALDRLPNVEVRAVNIPQWSGGALQYARLVHSKYMTIDASRSWVGTENWSKGYFTGSRNVGVSIASTPATRQINEIFDRVWTSAYAQPLP